jgi:hypothetical protein
MSDRLSSPTPATSPRPECTAEVTQTWRAGWDQKSAWPGKEILEIGFILKDLVPPLNPSNHNLM